MVIKARGSSSAAVEQRCLMSSILSESLAVEQKEQESSGRQPGSVPT